MTRAGSENRVSHYAAVPGAFGLDLVGRAQLAGLVVYVGGAFGTLGGRIVGDIRGESPVSATGWLISAGVGVVFGVASAVFQYWVWRRRGGQRLLRLSRIVWRTGDLPEALPVRVAVLRDLERRDRELDRQVPVIVLGVLWTIVGALQIATNHSPIDVIGWVLVWGLYAGFAARDIVDRRRWPRLRQLIAELREHPAGRVITVD